jgi:hypothetical protein
VPADETVRMHVDLKPRSLEKRKSVANLTAQAQGRGSKLRSG